MEKAVIVNIVLVIHLALTGLALLRLFKVKNATGGLVITSLLVLMIPIIGPSGLIVYLNKRITQQDKNGQKINSRIPKPTYKQQNKKK